MAKRVTKSKPTKRSAKKQVSTTVEPIKCYRIFLSHKQSGRDVTTAKLFKETLEENYPDKVTVFVAELSESSTKWEEQIFSNLRTSDEFVLLYSDNELHWDWPMFEAGCFLAHQSSDEASRIVTVIRHIRVEPPNIFRGIQHVKIDPTLNARSTERQPKRYLLELHERIIEKVGAARTANASTMSRARRELCAELIKSVGLSSDANCVDDLEFGFSVTLCPLKRGSNLKGTTMFEIESASGNRVWSNAFKTQQDNLTWNEFFGRSSKYLVLHPNLAECLSLWTVMHHNGVSQKLRLPSAKFISNNSVGKFTVIRARQLLNGSYRLTALLVPNSLPVAGEISDRDLYHAELFMALGRSLRFEAILPLLEFASQFEARPRISTSEASLFFHMVNTQLHFLTSS